MSRIHEALKRAEREKGRPVRPVQEEVQAPPTSAPVAHPDAARCPGRETAATAAAAAPATAHPPSSAAITPVAAAIAAATAPVPPPVASAAPVAVPPRPAAPAAVADAACPPASARSLLSSCRRAHWHEDVSKLLFLSGVGHAGATEQLRTLCSRLYQFREARPLKSVLVTSAMPGEGKSFICANLAYALARQSDRRVLLIDAQLRAPGLHSLLGAPSEPGLISYLRGETELEKVLQRGPHQNLFLIPAGKAAQDPAELLAAGKLKTLLAQAASLFDWILLDSAAAAPVCDALEIAGWCDGVLLVVQGGKTPYDLAQSVTRELREKHLLGVVLNRAEPSAASS